jgi:hypothetical protein
MSPVSNGWSPCSHLQEGTREELIPGGTGNRTSLITPEKVKVKLNLNAAISSG